VTSIICQPGPADAGRTMRATPKPLPSSTSSVTNSKSAILNVPVRICISAWPCSAEPGGSARARVWARGGGGGSVDSDRGDAECADW